MSKQRTPNKKKSSRKNDVSKSDLKTESSYLMFIAGFVFLGLLVALLFVGIQKFRFHNAASNERWEEVLQFDPDNVEALTRLAEESLTANPTNFEAVFEYLDRAEASGGDESRIGIMRADTYALKAMKVVETDFNLALEDFEKASSGNASAQQLADARTALKNAAIVAASESLATGKIALAAEQLFKASELGELSDLDRSLSFLLSYEQHKGFFEHPTEVDFEALKTQTLSFADLQGDQSSGVDIGPLPISGQIRDIPRNLKADLSERLKQASEHALTENIHFATDIFLLAEFVMPEVDDRPLRSRLETLLLSAYRQSIFRKPEDADRFYETLCKLSPETAVAAIHQNLDQAKSISNLNSLIKQLSATPQSDAKPVQRARQLIPSQFIADDVVVAVVINRNSYQIANGPNSGADVSLSKVVEIVNRSSGNAEGIRLRITLNETAEDGALRKLLAALKQSGIASDEIQTRFNNGPPPITDLVSNIKLQSNLGRRHGQRIVALLHGPNHSAIRTVRKHSELSTLVESRLESCNELLSAVAEAVETGDTPRLIEIHSRFFDLQKLFTRSWIQHSQPQETIDALHSRSVLPKSTTASVLSLIDSRSLFEDGEENFVSGSQRDFGESEHLTAWQVLPSLLQHKQYKKPIREELNQALHLVDRILGKAQLIELRELKAELEELREKVTERGKPQGKRATQSSETGNSDLKDALSSSLSGVLLQFALKAQSMLESDDQLSLSPNDVLRGVQSGSTVEQESVTYIIPSEIRQKISSYVIEHLNGPDESREADDMSIDPVCWDLNCSQVYLCGEIGCDPFKDDHVFIYVDRIVASLPPHEAKVELEHVCLPGVICEGDLARPFQVFDIGLGKSLVDDGHPAQQILCKDSGSVWPNGYLSRLGTAEVDLLVSEAEEAHKFALQQLSSGFFENELADEFDDESQRRRAIDGKRLFTALKRICLGTATWKEDVLEAHRSLNRLKSVDGWQRAIDGVDQLLSIATSDTVAIVSIGDLIQSLEIAALEAGVNADYNAAVRKILRKMITSTQSSRPVLPLEPSDPFLQDLEPLPPRPSPRLADKTILEIHVRPLNLNDDLDRALFAAGETESFDTRSVPNPNYDPEALPRWKREVHDVEQRNKETEERHRRNIADGVYENNPKWNQYMEAKELWQKSCNEMKERHEVWKRTRIAELEQAISELNERVSTSGDADALPKIGQAASDNSVWSSDRVKQFTYSSVSVLSDQSRRAGVEEQVATVKGGQKEDSNRTSTPMLSKEQAKELRRKQEAYEKAETYLKERERSATTPEDRIRWGQAASALNFLRTGNDRFLGMLPQQAVIDARAALARFK